MTSSDAYNIGYDGCKVKTLKTIVKLALEDPSTFLLMSELAAKLGWKEEYEVKLMEAKLEIAQRLVEQSTPSNNGEKT